MADLGNFVTIRETFTLPSRGKVYGIPDFNPEITLRSMTNAEDMLLTGYSENEYRKLSDVIQACIVSEKPKVDVYDMCIGDYEFLLHKLRIVTYGSEYAMAIQCPNCGEVVKSTVSLDDIREVVFDAEAIGNREITLPVSKLKVKLAFQTPRSLDQIKERAKEYKKKRNTPGINYDVMFEVMSFIQKIDGEQVNDAMLEDLVLKMPAKDARYIIQRGRELNGKVGLDTSIIAKCPECGYEVLTRFQYQSEFLNPTIPA